MQLQSPLHPTTTWLRTIEFARTVAALAMGGACARCCGWLFGSDAEADEEEEEDLLRSARKHTTTAVERLRARAEKRADMQRKTAVELEAMRQARADAHVP